MTAYLEAVNWLYQQLPNYQKDGATAYKPGLERIHAFLKALGNPQNETKFIHVAGTNGKGSVSHILAAIFQKHGYKTGLFTSPHIHDFRERIKINGKWVSEEFVLDFITQYKTEIEAHQASFFEITTAMAFQAFANQKCDIAIIETGLGGRLDATNVIDPELSVITNIGLDHTQFLGDTLEAIAGEKAGIIKENKPVVLGDMDPTLIPLFKEKASVNNATVYQSQSEGVEGNYKTDLQGSYQQRNIQTAITATSVLKAAWNLDEKITQEALLNVQKLSGLIGRFQKLQENPLVIADAGHNEAGVKLALSELDKIDFRELHILYGASNDKNWKSIIPLFPKNANLYLTQFDSKRSVKAIEFENFQKKVQFSAKIYVDSQTAYNQVIKNADKSDVVLVCGSFYLLEKII